MITFLKKDENNNILEIKWKKYNQDKYNNTFLNNLYENMDIMWVGSFIWLFWKNIMNEMMENKKYEETEINFIWDGILKWWVLKKRWISNEDIL
jgi:hypothetical protein